MKYRQHKYYVKTITLQSFNLKTSIKYLSTIKPMVFSKKKKKKDNIYIYIYMFYIIRYLYL